MITLMDAVQALKPGAECNIRGDVYSGIEWLDKTQTIPTEEEVTAKMKELTDAEPMKLLREERNRRLTETDWTRMDDNGLSTSKKTEWKTYRQSLRDLPSSATPKLDFLDNLDLTSVTWPTKPS
mgnify:FL=1|tara:strand:+ start:689 stop:1060 length:372 start_codon:yes stop_codon:yes gene_type:complete